ncbi:hypothetical protein ABZS77_26565 [Micromonospora sp. NPDC005298]|uniref:hypothetical protein n=1 Tax=Micromonospora sp. NPDC005298 TaxID=3156873 RepID=UPI0033AC5837
MESGFRRAVYRVQWYAPTVIPVLLIAVSIVAGGGLLLAVFVLLSVPLGLLLAVPPAVGQHVGRMRTSADITLWYAVCSVGVWAGCLVYGLVLTRVVVNGSGRSLPVAVLVLVSVVWVAQIVAAVLARRRNHGTGGDLSGPDAPQSGSTQVQGAEQPDTGWRRIWTQDAVWVVAGLVLLGTGGWFGAAVPYVLGAVATAVGAARFVLHLRARRPNGSSGPAGHPATDFPDSRSGTARSWSPPARTAGSPDSPGWTAMPVSSRCWTPATAGRRPD